MQAADGKQYKFRMCSQYSRAIHQASHGEDSNRTDCSCATVIKLFTDRQLLFVSFARARLLFTIRLDFWLKTQPTSLFSVPSSLRVPFAFLPFLPYVTPDLTTFKLTGNKNEQNQHAQHKQWQKRANNDEIESESKLKIIKTNNIYLRNWNEKRKKTIFFVFGLAHCLHSMKLCYESDISVVALATNIDSNQLGPFERSSSTFQMHLAIGIKNNRSDLPQIKRKRGEKW